MAYWDGRQWTADPSQRSAPARPKRRTTRISAIVVFALVPILLMTAATVLAARKPGSSATLSVTPNHAPAWGSATASGCGYGTSVVYLDIEKPEALAFTGATPDTNGCISVTFTTDGPGTYYLQTRQQSRNRWVVMANYELPVE